MSNDRDNFEEKLLELLDEDFDIKQLTGVADVNAVLTDYIKTIDTTAIIDKVVQDTVARNASSMRVEQLEKLDETTNVDLSKHLPAMIGNVIDTYRKEHGV